MWRVIVFIIAYLLGSIPFAYFAGRLKGIDVRKHGSGNIGTTNAFRLLGKKLGILVLLGDTAKGALAAGAGYYFYGPWGGILGGILAMLGHSWNPFFGFRPSGKGVASGFGIILILMPEVTIIAISIFLITIVLTRYVSMGSVFGALTVILLVFIFNEPLAYIVFALIAVPVVIIRHIGNIKRILNGTEHRIGDKKKK